MKTILIAEDDCDTANLYSMLLMTQGYIVLVTNSFRQAVEKAFTHKGVIDLLITDLHLGHELPAMLGKKVPKSTILITGKDPYPAKLYRGFDDYLIKPIYCCELLYKTVDNCLRLHDKVKRVA